MPLDITHRHITLHRGDIAVCRFPLAEAPGIPGPWERPCLVLDVRTDASGARVAQVAYGTHEEHGSNLGLDFSITDPADMTAASLHKPTRFVLGRTATLRVSPRWFALNAAGSPVLSRLPAKFRAVFESLDARRRTLATTSNAAPTARAQTGRIAPRRAPTRGRVLPITTPPAR